MTPKMLNWILHIYYTRWFSWENSNFYENKATYFLEQVFSQRNNNHTDALTVFEITMRIGPKYDF